MLSNQYEQELVAQGFDIIAGVDEVGRGPMAGPVVVCALILPHGLMINGVNDSKKLSEKKRVQLDAEIKSAAVAYAFGIIDVETIDRINILQATLRAMEMAVGELTPTPQAVLVDGTTAPDLNCKTVCLPQGDARSHLIAAASILAKVKRDAMMQELDKRYPAYGFGKHKGYGTKQHLLALEEFGLCPQHRRSFCKKYL